MKGRGAPPLWICPHGLLSFLLRCLSIAAFAHSFRSLFIIHSVRSPSASSISSQASTTTSSFPHHLFPTSIGHRFQTTFSNRKLPVSPKFELTLHRVSQRYRNSNSPNRRTRLISRIYLETIAVTIFVDYRVSESDIRFISSHPSIRGCTTTSTKATTNSTNFIVSSPPPFPRSSAYKLS